MRLNIPQQSAPGSEDFLSHPRKLKKWLTGLPQANTGETTRQLFTAIRQLNRQSIPNKHRMENLELLREPVRNIFDHLKKYFVNRTLPLPEKSKKIVNLNQALLQEMAHGYKIIVHEAANEIDKKVDKKTQGIAILRAMRYLSELLLRASEIYAEYPNRIWSDLHQMYHYAEIQNLHSKKFPDAEHHKKKTTIEHCYKQILLFALARPTAMRQRDTERLYQNLDDWAAMAKLGDNPKANQIDHVFCIHMEQDQPPSFLTVKDCENTETTRTLDAEKIVNTLNKQINKLEQKADAIVVGDEMPADTLKAIAMAWSVSAKRKFQRAERTGEITVAIGLKQAFKAILEGLAKPSIRKRPKQSQQPQARSESLYQTDENAFTLATVSENMKSSSHTDSRSNSHQVSNSDEDNAWDMVAKGRVLTDAYDKERKSTAEASGALNKEEPDLYWEVVNFSAGGYCLRWKSATTSNAQVGELIVVLVNTSDLSQHWSIGLIRRMQTTRDHALEIGVQILSPRVHAAKVNRKNRLNEEPFEGLLLPGIKSLQQSASILVPTHAFKTGNQLIIEVNDQTMQIQLGEILENTGSFTQFEFDLQDEGGKTLQSSSDNEAEAGKKDDFDEIWSSL